MTPLIPINLIDQPPGGVPVRMPNRRANGTRAVSDPHEEMTMPSFQDAIDATLSEAIADAEYRAHLQKAETAPAPSRDPPGARPVDIAADDSVDRADEYYSRRLGF